MKEKILIVGGSHSEIPLILATKKLGYHVVTTGNRRDDLGHQYADEYEYADFSNYEAIYSLAKKLNVRGICSGCNDFAAISTAYAAELLCLPGHDSFEKAKLIHHKDTYRALALSNQILSPQAQSFDDVNTAIHSADTFNFPVIVKPVDLTGGKGISIAHNEHEVIDAIQLAFKATKNKRIVIEEFIEGTRHGFSTFLLNGKVAFYFIDDEYYYKNPFLVSAASTPYKLLQGVIDELKLSCEKIAEILELKDGIFHVQFILKDNRPYIIEICRRSPGDLYILLVEYATGVSYSEWIVKASLGLNCKDIQQVNPTGYFTRHCIMSHGNGVIDTIDYSASIRENIINEVSWWKSNDIIENSMVHKCGIVFLQFSSADEMRQKTMSMQDSIKVILK